MRASIEIPNYTVEPTFPAFYQSIDSELVVLFTGLETGFVVVPEGLRGIGDRTTWHSCANDAKWKRLPDGTKVTIMQEGEANE